MTFTEFRDQHPDQEQSVICAAGRTIAIEAVRAHVEEMQARPPMLDGRPIEADQLVGHLMAAEVLLMQVARAFTPVA